MAIQVGNSWVSEAAYAYAQGRMNEAASKDGVMESLKEKFPDTDFSVNTSPFQGKGTRNIAIAPNILKQMENDPQKRMEYEALIYDCVSLQKSLPKTNSAGGQLKAQGFIINADGTLGSWSISTSGDSGDSRRHSCKLDKKDKGEWLERILERKEERKAREARRESAIEKSRQYKKTIFDKKV